MMKPKIYMNDMSINEWQFEKATVNQSDDNKSTLQNSTHYDKKLLSVQVKIENNRLYSSAVCQKKRFEIYKQSTCNKHDKMFQYICKSCEQNICPQCLRDLSKHRGHRFEKYRRLQQSEEKKKMQKYSEMLKLKKEEIVQQLVKRACFKKEMEKQVELAIEQMKITRQRISQFHERNELLIASKLENDQKHINQANSVYESILYQLHNTKPVPFLQQKSFTIQEELLSNLAALDALKEGKIQRKAINIPGFVRPNFYFVQYTINSFTKLKLQQAQVLFQPFEAFLSCWRLKVYPGGFHGSERSKNGDVEYLSVYLQRLDGIVNTSQLIVEIQMHSENKKLMIKKQFSAEFCKKQSWGYEKYTRTSNLYEHQFLSKEDSLKIKLSIAPARYHQGCRHLQRMIQLKSTEAEERRKKLVFLTALSRKQSRKRNKHLLSENSVYDQDLEFSQLKSVSSIKIGNFEADHKQRGNQKEKSQSSLGINKHADKEGHSQDGYGQKKNIITSFPSITLDSKSPRNLIRLISSKNLDLMQSVKKKSHHRSVTFL